MVHSREAKADWVICVDADEFIYHPKMLEELAGELEIPDHQLLRCEGYQMLSEHFPTTQGQIYEEVKKGVYDPRYTKSVVFRPCIHLIFAPGRHGVTSEQAKPKECNLRLLHFRFLSPEYVHAMHDRNYNRLTKLNKDKGFGAHNSPHHHGEYDLIWYKEKLKEAVPCLD